MRPKASQKNPGVTCYNCGNVGHIVRSCGTAAQGTTSQGPTSSTCRAKTFTMTKRSNAQDSDVVAGASKSFWSKECVNKMDLMLEDLAEPLTIEVANQDRVSVSQSCLKCQLEIHRHSFSADRIPFELGEFDVILGIDWLSQHKENIDFKKKIMIFTEVNIKVNDQGKRQENKFLSILKARKLLRQGCEAYLAHIVDTKKEVPNLDEILIAVEFSDDFSDQLPGLPPDREIEFSIDLVPNAKPVSKAPYCMTSGKEGII
ncbi:uncharacterized protein LOC141665674 [Apium graveolens]|uniref:uncharacterized protein LOC141665674 n=1 Tax=Apium graveolens TaxID=4045 RepID=UPI003D798463